MGIIKIEMESKRAGAALFHSLGKPPFHIKVHDEVWEDAYFITSETFDPEKPRRFTVRYFDAKTGKLSLVSDFRQFPSHLAAKLWLENGLYNQERGTTKPWFRKTSGEAP